MRFPLILSLLVALVSAIDLLGFANWQQYALRPRDWGQLYGIFTAPFLHGSWEHLLSNLPPLFFLAAGLKLFYDKIFWPVLLSGWFATGLWTFLMARSSLHLGASGLVYALAFFLFFSGVFRRDVRSLSLALVVAMFYGSMVWGVFPAQPGISWESHLFGALAGLLMAFYYRKKVDPPSKTYSWEREEDRPDETGIWDYRRHFEPPSGFQHPGE